MLKQNAGQLCYALKHTYIFSRYLIVIFMLLTTGSKVHDMRRLICKGDVSETALESTAAIKHPGTTGAFFHWSNSFVACLEGDARKVEETLSNLYQSSEHKNIEVLVDTDAPQRRFSDWHSSDLASVDGPFLEQKYSLSNTSDQLLSDPLVVYSLLCDTTTKA